MQKYLTYTALLVTTLCAGGCSDDSSDDNDGGASGAAGSAGAAGGAAGAAGAAGAPGTAGAAGAGGAAGAAGAAGAGATANADLSFFVTSETHSGDLGGLDGADTICETLAAAVGAGGKTWRAYLSAADGGGGTAVNARDRIGDGPWVNAAGVTLAQDLTALHAATLLGNADLFLNERGEKIQGQWVGSPTPVQHDIMTGSSADGNLIAGATCADWTSSAADPGGPQVGHSDGMGPNMATTGTFTSWNSSHQAPNCSVAGLQMVGGAGRFYCFAE